MQASSIKVLLVEDFEVDVESIVRALKQEYEFVHVTNVLRKSDYIQALDGDYDLIICDDQLPDLNSFDAFEILRRSGKDIPFIIISGAISEYRAAQTLKLGAADFISKDSLVRLCSAAREALENRRLREANRKTSAELTDAQERLQVAMESTDIGTWDYWPEDAVFAFCQRATQLLGTSVAAPTLGAFLEWIDSADRGRVESALKEPSGPAINLEFKLQVSETWICLKGRVHPPGEGRKSRMIGVLFDITDQKLKENILITQSHQSESANRAKSAFLANMSHEIRTPLGVIEGYADLLLHSNDTRTEEQDQYLQRIIYNCQELTNLINDILDLAKVEQGQMDIEKSNVNVAELVEDILTLFRGKAQKKNIALTSHIDRSVPKWIHTDRKRLKQIMINILGNAIKFTRKGFVRLHVNGAVHSDRPGLIAFQVTDSGIGICKSEELFQPFHQEDASTARRFGGTGLGLALSRSLARDLGGDVELVETRAGIGSTFRITVAANSPVGSVEVEKSASPTTGGARPLDAMKILLVDDSRDNQLVISRMLQRSGAEVTVVSNGVEAIEEGKDPSYDAIVMDIQMPIMDGCTATRRLRSMGTQIPIIALTAHAMSEEVQKSGDVGFSSYLTKPVNKEKLIAQLAAYWNEHDPSYSDEPRLNLH